MINMCDCVTLFDSSLIVTLPWWVGGWVAGGGCGSRGGGGCGFYCRSSGGYGCGRGDWLRWVAVADATAVAAAV